MKITNKLGLPESFVQMATYEEKMDDKRIRVTSLLSGLRETELKRRYKNKCTQDCADMIWLLIGTAVHSILEQQKEKDDEFKEERLEMPISNSVLTGKSDLYQNGIITDYKTCSVWKIIKGDYEDWKKQLLLYAMLWDSYGFPIKGGKIVAVMKDHSKSKAKYDPQYPQYPVQTIEWTFSKKDIAQIKKFATDRIKALEKLHDVPDELLPMCTFEERFNKGDKYAVMKKNRKTALRVLDSLNEANAWMAAKGGDFIEERKGEDIKCKEYCQVREFCPYGRSL